MTLQDPPVPLKILPSKVPTISVADLSNRILLQSYAPASVTTDIKGNILYVHGDTSRYISTPSGPVTTNVAEMAHEGLQLALRAALQAAAQGEPTLSSYVTIKSETGVFSANFSVRLLPLPRSDANTDERLLLISFQNVDAQPATKRGRSKSAVVAAELSRNEQLERDLLFSRENQQAIIEEQQATTEELKSANEELQSTNEELQSANEELETSKEEMQSLNEETITVNSELNTKIELLSASQNDLKNLMDNVTTGIVFLDYHLNIRSYTPEAVKVYRLITSDVGRPLGDITSNLQGESLLDELHLVLKTLVPREREVQTNDGIWYLLRIQPYRTLDNVIDGVVLSFTDINELRKSTIKLSEQRVALDLSEGIFNTIHKALLLLNSDLQVVSANQYFYEHFQVAREQTVGRKVFDLGNGQWNIPTLRELLEDILPKHQVMDGFVVEHIFPDLGKRKMVLNARRIKTSLGETDLILLAFMDVLTKE